MLRAGDALRVLQRRAVEEAIAVDKGFIVISVFDYGAGNLRSVQNTLGAIGAEYGLIRDAAGIQQATKLILPGVGHFGQMMRALDDLQVRDALIERIRAGVPFLGICLGLQGLFESSEEAPEERGLGIFPGQVKRFRGDLRIPHMGWNQVQPCRPNTLLASAAYLYFAHSYYCPVVPETAAVCHYMVPYTAVLEQANVRGVQFHPEKSGPAGLQIVRNFVES
jgi:imidazole glycerol phosphate synthase glutamine amidotransferase subunit